jgi:hypothetical protein
MSRKMVKVINRWGPYTRINQNRIQKFKEDYTRIIDTDELNEVC